MCKKILLLFFIFCYSTIIFSASDTRSLSDQVINSINGDEEVTYTCVALPLSFLAFENISTIPLIGIGFGSFGEKDVNWNTSCFFGPSSDNSTAFGISYGLGYGLFLLDNIHFTMGLNISTYILMNADDDMYLIGAPELKLTYVPNKTSPVNFSLSVAYGSDFLNSYDKQEVSPLQISLAIGLQKYNGSKQSVVQLD